VGTPGCREFRRKLAPYLFVNGVIVVASVVGANDYFAVTVFWSIYLAFKYAKLWVRGLRLARRLPSAPRSRLIDVADDALMYVRAMFNRNQRQACESSAVPRLVARVVQTTCRAFPGMSGDDVIGALAATAIESGKRSDRNEVLRLLEQMRLGSVRAFRTLVVRERAGGQDSGACAGAGDLEQGVAGSGSPRSSRKSRAWKARPIHWMRVAATSGCVVWRN